jgi:hypothetical protein
MQEHDGQPPRDVGPALPIVSVVVRGGGPVSVIARLSDPWFDAKFMRNTTAKGSEYTDLLEGADGLWFWCPCGFGKPEFPLDGGRPHGVMVSFANPRGCVPAPADGGSQSRNGGPSRWTIAAGSGLGDLTLQPSIAVGTPECWHGFITGGEIS